MFQTGLTRYDQENTHFTCMMTQIHTKIYCIYSICHNNKYQSMNIILINNLVMARDSESGSG